MIFHIGEPCQKYSVFRRERKKSRPPTDGILKEPKRLKDPIVFHGDQNPSNHFLRPHLFSVQYSVRTGLRGGLETEN
jgi:hypothetical protein